MPSLGARSPCSDLKLIVQTIKALYLMEIEEFRCHLLKIKIMLYGLSGMINQQCNRKKLKVLGYSVEFRIKVSEMV